MLDVTPFLNISYKEYHKEEKHLSKIIEGIQFELIFLKNS